MSAILFVASGGGVVSLLYGPIDALSRIGDTIRIGGQTSLGLFCMFIANLLFYGIIIASVCLLAWGGAQLGRNLAEKHWILKPVREWRYVTRDEEEKINELMRA